jgi:hypothetical protein
VDSPLFVNLYPDLKSVIANSPSEEFIQKTREDFDSDDETFEMEVDIPTDESGPYQRFSAGNQRMEL